MAVDGKETPVSPPCARPFSSGLARHRRRGSSLPIAPFDAPDLRALMESAFAPIPVPPGVRGVRDVRQRDQPAPAQALLPSVSSRSCRPRRVTDAENQLERRREADQCRLSDLRSQASRALLHPAHPRRKQRTQRADGRPELCSRNAAAAPPTPAPSVRNGDETW